MENEVKEGLITKIRNMKLKSELSEEDKKSIAQRLAEISLKVQEYEKEETELKREHKAELDDLKEEKERLTAELRIKATDYQNGYIEKIVECRVTYNEPKEGIKTVERIDNHHTFQEAMTDDEIEDLFHGDHNVKSSSQEITDKYGFNPEEVVKKDGEFDFFIAMEEQDLIDHELDHEIDFKNFQECLFVKASHEAIKPVFNKVVYYYKKQISKGISWYAFQPVGTIAGDSYDVSVDDTADEEAAEEE